jgi:hypothetical protein
MRVMNKRLNLPQLQQIMREFERQNERMEMTSEMMGDAVDDAFEVGAGGTGERAAAAAAAAAGPTRAWRMPGVLCWRAAARWPTGALASWSP